MHMNRKSRLSQAVNISPRHSDPPTPKIVAKLRYDIIARLHSRGRIGARYLVITEEIRAVHEAVGRGMFPTAQLIQPRAGTQGRRGPRDFFDRMTQWERHVWEHHYLPWTRDLSTEVVAGMAGTRWLQLIVDIVVDNIPLREIETRYGLRHGTAIAYLTNGLDRYNPGT